MKLLLVSGASPEGEPGSDDASRRIELARAAASAATRVVLVRTPDEPVAAGPPGRFEALIELDRDQLAGGLALDGVARDFGPDAIVALGTEASLAVGRLTGSAPAWLDFAAEPLDEGVAMARPWGRDGPVDRWHDLLWAIDRGDRISSATARTHAALRALLALRGRFAAADAADPELFHLETGATGALAEWVRSPRRKATAARVLGLAEIGDLSRAAAAEARHAALRGGAATRLSALVSRGAAGSRRTMRRLGRAIRRAASAPGLLSEAFVPAGRAQAFSIPEPPDAAPLAARLGRAPRLLVVMPYRIFPPRHGGAVRLAGILRQLAASCELHLLRLDQRGENRLERAELERYCRRVEFHHWVVPPAGAAPDLRLPPMARVFADEKLAWRIRHWVESEGIDVVQLECAEMAQYRAAARPAQVILVELDVAFLSQARRRSLDLGARYSREPHQSSSALDVLLLRRYELAAAREVDQLHAMSDRDAAELARRLPDGARRIRVVPNGVDIAALAGPEPEGGRSGVLFLGNYAHLPNRDALDWFLDEIWEGVRAGRSDARLTVAGAEMPVALAERAARAGANVIGEVEDVAGIYRRHLVLAVPLRAGSGTRLKILEAFAAGAAVVATTLGAEGLDVVAGEHLLIADDAPAFARAVSELLSDPARARRLATAAASRVAERYDVRRVAERSLGAVLELAVAHPAPTPASPAARPSPVDLDVAIVLPTRRGGELLQTVLAAIAAQRTTRTFEVVCIDSGSSPTELEAMRAAGARIVSIPGASFDHGRTRDEGAAASRGRVLVFLNQDAVPVDEEWLERLTAPLFATVPPAAVQGGIREFATGAPGAPPRLYWDSSGPRFNFTRESVRWIERFGGLGFSTVNCAIRRDVWNRIPFGKVSIMEDKLWQQRATEHEHRIVTVDAAAVFHTHHYGVGGLFHRSVAEGEGWRRLGERYRLAEAIGDACRSAVWRDWRAGARARQLHSVAEWTFPVLRPLALWWGNHRAGREIR